MKKFFIGLFVILSTITTAIAYGQIVGTPGTMVERNPATTSIPTLYTLLGAELQTAIKGASNFFIYNGSASSIAISVRGTACGSSTTDNYMIPTTSGLVVDSVAIGKVICIRSLSGSSITSGKIYSNAW